MAELKQAEIRVLVVAPDAASYRRYCEDHKLVMGRDSLYAKDDVFLRGRRPNKFKLVWHEDGRMFESHGERFDKLNRTAASMGFETSEFYKPNHARQTMSKFRDGDRS